MAARRVWVCLREQVGMCCLFSVPDVTARGSDSAALSVVCVNVRQVDVAGAVVIDAELG